MANKKIESLTEIKEAVAATSAVAETKRKPARDKQGRSYATGKRKNAVARVWIMPGKGNITINGETVELCEPIPAFGWKVLNASEGSGADDRM